MKAKEELIVLEAHRATYINISCCDWEAPENIPRNHDVVSIIVCVCEMCGYFGVLCNL